MRSVLKNLEQIKKGWWFYFFKNEKIEEEAKRKAVICQGCDSAVMSVWDEVLPDTTLKEVKGMMCSECSCPLSTLLRSKKSCVIGKF